MQDFLAQKRLAVAGVSRNNSHHPVGNLIYHRLKKSRHDVFPVNPHMHMFEGDRCYPDVQSIPGGVDGVVISDGLWRRRFAGSRSVLGQRVSINGISREIVGVMPPAYQAPPPVVLEGQPPADRAELWIPLAIDLATGQRRAHNLTVIARLRRAATVETADRDVKRIAAEVASEHPESVRAARGYTLGD